MFLAGTRAAMERNEFHDSFSSEKGTGEHVVLVGVHSRGENPGVQRG